MLHSIWLNLDADWFDLMVDDDDEIRNIARQIAPPHLAGSAKWRRLDGMSNWWLISIYTVFPVSVILSLKYDIEWVMLVGMLSPIVIYQIEKALHLRKFRRQ